jgi:periplasmic divalent cation tolerance protein
VFVTCGSRKEARRLAQAVVEQRLAACANIFSAPVESIYRWKGRVEVAREVFLIIKTSRARFAALQREIARLHSYEVPEIIALPIVTGSRDYMKWMAKSLEPVKSRKS